MGMFDSIGNLFSGGGNTTDNKALQNSNNYYSPYYNGGQTAYNQMQTNTQNMGNNLNPYSHAADYMYGQINQSPTSYYNNIMSGYSESPDAKYEQEQAMRAANAGGAASGMLGSGAYYKDLQQNANDISQRDRQQYYSNVMGANQSQLASLQNLQSQQNLYDQNLQYLTQLGYGAGSSMAGNTMNMSMQNAKNNNQGMGDLESLGMMGAEYYLNRNGGSGGFGGGMGASGGGSGGGNMWGTVLPIAGTVVGGMYGGPAGAAAGGAAGNYLGQKMSN